MPEKPKHSILAIDDSEAEMRLMIEAARMSGLEEIAILKTYYNTEEGFAALEQSVVEGDVIDAIFLDLNVPKMGGVELLRLIKTDKRFSHIPVFILTNSDNRGDILACIQHGADAYFQKPSNFNKFIDFFTAVRRSLERDARISIPFIQQQFGELRKVS
ncbi:MAG: hypothetical protein JWO03_1168 [Bacteroidetes bacterium]|nr:hypothetical protein [Bacteroidota bacterium]